MPEKTTSVQIVLPQHCNGYAKPRLFGGHAVSSSKALFFHMRTYTRVISGSPSPWAMQRNSQPYRS